MHLLTQNDWGFEEKEQLAILGELKQHMDQHACTHVAYDHVHTLIYCQNIMISNS